MPSLKNYSEFIYVTVCFILLTLMNVLLLSNKEVKENWEKYRCNPSYWIYSDDLNKDFTYCVQNTQVNMMGYLLQPITQLTSSLMNMGGDLSGSVNNARGMISNIREFATSIVENIYSVFQNLAIHFQTTTISINDMVGKIIGTVVTMMYVMDGSIKTMNSTWKGPPGQLVRAIGSCFHPDTPVLLKNGEIYAMKDIPLGSELTDGSKVYSVMKIANFGLRDKLYKIDGGVNGDPIFVTGSHYIYDKREETFIQVKNSKLAEPQHEISSDWFSCLITTTGQIKLGKHIFWDWEDDEIQFPNTLFYEIFSGFRKHVNY